VTARSSGKTERVAAPVRVGDRDGSHAAPGAAPIERPQAPVNAEGVWGSDVVADALRALDLPYVALNPGASYRGLHDSLVNHLGNTRPQMLLCLHEEAAVALAHGYAKVAGRPMGAVVHSNVGLMHATMAIFNAWCDRVPVIVLGATGPVDTVKRRPWIDWIHTARDQGALVRDYTKWDDQPASVEAAVESILRAHMLATTAPQGPVYVCLDAGLQEAKLETAPAIPDPQRFLAPEPAYPAAELIAEAAQRLHRAERPLILMGRHSRRMEDWQNRVKLAEALDAVVLTDNKLGAAFPTAHPLFGAPATTFPTPPRIELMRGADVILALDCVDLAGDLNAAWQGSAVKSFVIQASVDQQIHRGWSMDYQGLAPVDLRLLAEPDATVTLLLAEVGRLGARKSTAWPGRTPPEKAKLPRPETERSISVPLLAACLKEALGGRDSCLMRKPLSWAGQLWDVAHPLDLLGDEGGGGIGSGPGMSMGSALALKGSGRLAVSILGDGDFLMGVTALWTGVHYRVPALVLVANNRSYFNDEIHQDRVARARGRPAANRWIGQRMDDPEIDLAALARAQGAVAFGPIADPAQLMPTLARAIQEVEAGRLVVVDVHVEPGYDPSTASAMTRAAAKPSEGKA
jgi:thiamine pyrophosphate-dependent acetolactate synthase large subunit-like protein